MTAFFKVSGGGNDFVALAEPPAEPTAEQVLGWCRRGVSLGADGVFVIRRAPAEAQQIAMTYRNADGLPAELCLNGTRCAAQLAFHLGWAHDRVRIQTTAGAFDARRVDAQRVTLALDLPISPPQPLAVDLEGDTHAGYRVRVGVPHFLLPWAGDLAAAPVATAGRRLRQHAVFQPAGTNVNWVRFTGPHDLAIRTYERGVEGETLACGTGVVAAAATGLHLDRVALPVTVATQGGFSLIVDRDADGRFTLTGDARVVAAGEILPGALAIAVPPSPTSAPVQALAGSSASA